MNKGVAFVYLLCTTTVLPISVCQRGLNSPIGGIRDSFGGSWEGDNCEGWGAHYKWWGICQFCFFNTKGAIGRSMMTSRGRLITKGWEPLSKYCSSTQPSSPLQSSCPWSWTLSAVCHTHTHFYCTLFLIHLHSVCVHWVQQISPKARNITGTGIPTKPWLNQLS